MIVLAGTRHKSSKQPVDASDKMGRIPREYLLYARLAESRIPLPTSTIMGAVYGSNKEQPDFESSMTAFRRDREALESDTGARIVECRDEGAARNVDASWKMDPARLVGKSECDPTTCNHVLDIIESLELRLEDPKAPDRREVSRIIQLLYHAIGENVLDQGAERIADKQDTAADYIHQSLHMKRAAVFDYTKPDGETSRRTVEVYGTFNDRGRFYFAGRDISGQDPTQWRVKNFRTDRIKKTFKQKGAYSVPNDFQTNDVRFLPIDFSDSSICELVYSFPAGIGQAELQTSVCQWRGKLTRSETEEWRWHVMGHADLAAQFAILHADLFMRPISPESAVKDWEHELKRRGGIDA